MPELICDTSALQYLHQIGCLEVLQSLASQVVAPPAVAKELAAGIADGYNVPDIGQIGWSTIRCPKEESTVTEVFGLGSGERQVLALALESAEAIAVLDDRAARRAAEELRVRFTGTLGLLLDAKRLGRLTAIAPLLKKLRGLGFRLSARTEAMLLD